MAFYKLRTGDLFSDVGKVPQMLAKGKLSLLPKRSGGAGEVREVFRRAEEEEKTREIRVLSRLQSGIDRVGFRPVHPGGLPRAGDRTGGHSRLGLLRIDAGPRQQRLAGRGAAGAESAEGQAAGPAGDDGLRLVLRPAADRQSQGPQRGRPIASGPSGSPASPTTAASRSITCSTCW